MRNHHLHIERELGKESVILLWHWGNLVKKMVNYNNHRRFSLRCLSAGTAPVSIRLKIMVTTLGSFDIIRRAEKQLLIESTRDINNIIKISSLERDKCSKGFIAGGCSGISSHCL